ncbi:hypothetical protein FACS189413_16990 [Bacteroidia bacterium]|nr:hypothetical protein FACS189413_16990 [Bacteroidia bacterium]
MKRREIVLAMLLFIGILPVCAQPKISFFEEHIDFELDSIYFTVNGIYSFRNLTDKANNQCIIFPFAVETPQIDSINIINLNNLSRISFLHLKKAVAFEINLLPYDTVDVNIFYKQQTVEKNTYIVTSTQSWRRALKKAVYTLTSALPIDESRFSYPFISKEIRDNKMFYHWEETDFMPDKEFEVFIKSF